MTGLSFLLRVGTGPRPSWWDNCWGPENPGRGDQGSPGHLLGPVGEERAELDLSSVLRSSVTWGRARDAGTPPGGAREPTASTGAPPTHPECQKLDAIEKPPANILPPKWPDEPGATRCCLERRARENPAPEGRAPGALPQHPGPRHRGRHPSLRDTQEPALLRGEAEWWGQGHGRQKTTPSGASWAVKGREQVVVP